MRTIRRNFGVASVLFSLLTATTGARAEEARDMTLVDFVGQVKEAVVKAGQETGLSVKSIEMVLQGTVKFDAKVGASFVIGGLNAERDKERIQTITIRLEPGKILQGTTRGGVDAVQLYQAIRDVAESLKVMKPEFELADGSVELQCKIGTNGGVQAKGTVVVPLQAGLEAENELIQRVKINFSGLRKRG